jgi:hypothetical protein
MTIEIKQYTEKSFVIVGDTKPLKDSIKSFGAKWNSSLTDGETNEKFGGWILFNDKKQEVADWIESGCPTRYTSSSSSASRYQSQPLMTMPQSPLQHKIDDLSQRMDVMTQRLTTLIQAFNNLEARLVGDDDSQDQE